MGDDEERFPVSVYIFHGTALWPGEVLQNVAVVIARTGAEAKELLVQEGMDPNLIDLATIKIRPIERTPFACPEFLFASRSEMPGD